MREGIAPLAFSASFCFRLAVFGIAECFCFLTTRTTTSIFLPSFRWAQSPTEGGTSRCNQQKQSLIFHNIWGFEGGATPLSRESQRESSSSMLQGARVIPAWGRGLRTRGAGPWSPPPTRGQPGVLGRVGLAHSRRHQWPRTAQDTRSCCRRDASHWKLNHSLFLSFGLLRPSSL